MYHRGDSGQKKTWAMTTIGGIAVDPNIQRHCGKADAGSLAGSPTPAGLGTVTFWKATEAMKPSICRSVYVQLDR